MQRGPHRCEPRYLLTTGSASTTKLERQAEAELERPRRLLRTERGYRCSAVWPKFLFSTGVTLSS